MSQLISSDLKAALRLQGISTDAFIGVFGCSPVLTDLIRGIAGEKSVVVLQTAEEGQRAARSSPHFAMAVGGAQAANFLSVLGSDAGQVVSVIVIGETSHSSWSGLRAAGAMAVVDDPTESLLATLFRRALEVRALRALELAHRCEGRRLHRREMDLVGHPPEFMTDDLNTFQAPPLPVGPISTYNLEEASEAFERAYIDRVQHLCASAREAAVRLDVSAATLARRMRKEGSTDVS